MSTNVNNLDEKALKKSVEALDPLGVMPETKHLLPEVDLTEEAKRGEEGSLPLKQHDHEEFCGILTGWSGDGERISAYKAYQEVYGQEKKSPRSSAARLMARPEVAARIKYLEKKVNERRRHDYRVAQQEIDEMRLGIIQKAKKNSKLLPLALTAARDFEKAHGLDESASADEETKSLSIAETDGFGSIRAAILKVTRKRKPE